MFYTIAGIVIYASILIGLIGSLVLISLDEICDKARDISMIALVVFLVMLMTNLIVSSIDSYISINTNTTYTSIETLDKTKTGVFIIGLYTTEKGSYYVVTTEDSAQKYLITSTVLISSSKYDTPFLCTRTFKIKNKLVRAIKFDETSLRYELCVPENYTIQQVKEL